MTVIRGGETTVLIGQVSGFDQPEIIELRPKFWYLELDEIGECVGQKFVTYGDHTRRGTAAKKDRI